MNVNQIISRLTEINHGDEELTDEMKGKALEWLNNAYHELMDDMMPHLSRYLVHKEDLKAVKGQADTSIGIYDIVKVTDLSNMRYLEEKSLSEILDIDPDMSLVGLPEFFWIEGDNTIKLHPRADIDLGVKYLPQIEDLKIGGLEQTILIPKKFHAALVWGGLVWSSVYERGLATQAEITLFQRKWEEAKRNMNLALASKQSTRLKLNEI